MAANDFTAPASRRTVINELVDQDARVQANAVNPMVSTFSAADTLETCAATMGELGELISIANGRDPQCNLGNVFHLFNTIRAAMAFELAAGQVEAV